MLQNRRVNGLEGTVTSWTAADWRSVAGWSGIIAGCAGIIGNLALVLFFTIEMPRIPPSAAGNQPWGTGGQFWGPLSDVAGLFQFGLLIPVAMGMRRLLPGRGTRADVVVLVVGCIAMAADVVFGLLLITRVLVADQQLPGAGTAIVLIAAWLAAASYRARQQHTLGPWLVRLGLASGLLILASAVVVAVTMALPGSALPTRIVRYVFGGAGLIGYLAMPVWAALFGVTLLRSRRSEWR